MKKKKLWMLAAILTFGFVLTACSNNDDPVVPPTDDVEAQLQKMTLREKVGQMFFIRMESLDPSVDWTTYDDLANIKIMEVTENMKAVNENYPVGGIILYAWNIDNEAQLARLIPQVRALNGHPTSAEAAVGSIQAGVDIVLGPRYFTEAFDAVMAAVNHGTISEERINQSVRRILKLRKERERPL